MTVGEKEKGFQSFPYSHAGRFGDDNKVANPEEMIGAAHAGCYSMFLSALISKEGLSPDSVRKQPAGQFVIVESQTHMCCKLLLCLGMVLVVDPSGSRSN